MSNPGIDLELTKRPSDGIYDLSLTDGDLTSLDSFDTSIYMTLFCEQRADESEVPVVFNRRGWWGNILSEVPNFEIGSKVWLYEQSRKNQNTLNGLITVCQNAFSWYVTQGYAQNVVVDGSINRDGIQINIQIFVSKNITDAKSYELWLNTGTTTFNVTIV